MASTVWLTYWIIFGFFTAFDKLLGVILFFIPGYYLLKAIFYTWMFYPRTKGAQVIYENFLKPQLLKLRDLAHKKND
jgi:receptor expression-enhancing protein 5/6